MNTQHLFQQIQKKQSFLCVGLDTDLEKIPEYLLDNDDPIYAFR
jgi:orotidine-5'-phosphate decarboxylase